MKNPFENVSWESSQPNPLENVSWETATPPDVKSAQAQIGNQTFDNYCETFAERVTGNPNMGASAREAWGNYSQMGKAVVGTNGIKPGDLIYFNDPNQPDDHVGIYQGKNTMISATENGVESANISDWLKQTGQSINGYVPLNKPKSTNPLDTISWGSN